MSGSVIEKLGIRGATGATGEQGIQGIQGATGATGAPGDIAGDFDASYSEKILLADDDLFIINDSEASGALKYVKRSNVGGGGTTKNIAQTAHGFTVVGTPVRFNGTSYVAAQADSVANAEVAGLVSMITDVNNFTLLAGGYISGLTGLTAGSVYFLDRATAGAFTTTDPLAEGVINSVSKPLLIAISTTEAIFMNMRGSVVGGGDLSTMAQAGYKNLVMAYASATTITATADFVILEDSSGATLRFPNFSETFTITSAGVNGLDTGAEASSTWYHVWAIGKADGTLDGLLSASATAPTLPAGYTFKCYLGAVLNNASGNFVNFTQKDNKVVGIAATVLTTASSASLAAINIAPAVPSTAKKAIGAGYGYVNPGAGVQFILASDSNGLNSLYFMNYFAGASTTVYYETGFSLPLTIAQTIYYSTSYGVLTVWITGWEY